MKPGGSARGRDGKNAVAWVFGRVQLLKRFATEKTAAEAQSIHLGRSIA
jgi:hypothetical protein